MTRTNRTAIRRLRALCTALALSGPAMAHDGPHNLTLLESVLHELAYTDYLYGALAMGAMGVALACRVIRRRSAAAAL